MKTIVAVWNASNRGKTKTLLEIATILRDMYGVDKIKLWNENKKGDIRVVIDTGSSIIVIESEGDPATYLKERLEDIVERYNPSLLFCATRTKGDTVHAVENLKINHHYQTIWTSTYQMENEAAQPLINNLKAKHILELLQSLSLL